MTCDIDIHLPRKCLFFFYLKNKMSDLTERHVSFGVSCSQAQWKEGLNKTLTDTFICLFYPGRSDKDSVLANTTGCCLFNLVFF